MTIKIHESAGFFCCTRFLVPMLQRGNALPGRSASLPSPFPDLKGLVDVLVPVKIPGNGGPGDIFNGPLR